jgi:ABC-type branched-subunit amino acid transport system substrate-binding protein
VAHAQALAERARAQLGIRRVATLYHNDRDSRTYAAVFRRAFTELGGTLLAEDPFSLALPSFEPYLTRAAARGRVDGLLIIGGGTIIDPILAALDSLGTNPTIMGNMDLLRNAQAAGRDLEGALLSTAYLSERGAPKNVAFVTAFLQAHGGQRPDPTAAGAYDIVHLLANAIDNRGPNRASVRTYLSGVGTVTEPFEGATGSIAFDPDGNLRRISVEVGVVRDGTIVPLPER